MKLYNTLTRTRDEFVCYVTGGIVYWAILRYIKNKNEGTRSNL